jgi:hypothetical protein
VWEARRVEAEFNAAVERFHMLRMLDLPGDATPQEIAARFDGLPVLRAPGRPEPRPPYLRYSDLVSDDG